MSKTAENLCKFINKSPRSELVVESIKEKFLENNIKEIEFNEDFPIVSGKYFIKNQGSILAFEIPENKIDNKSEFRIFAAHSDSPHLKIKSNVVSEVENKNFEILSVEPYGGLVYSSWMDRDLSISGKIITNKNLIPKVVEGFQTKVNKINEQLQEILVYSNLPLYHISRLAIHLQTQRNIDDINPQFHLNPYDLNSHKDIKEYLLTIFGIDKAEVFDLDLQLHPSELAKLVGWEKKGISSARLDNQVSCFVGMEAFINFDSKNNNFIPIFAVFDHEEVGSTSNQGANSIKLNEFLLRIIISQQMTFETFLQIKQNSLIVSSDMAHATNPNYLEKHDPNFRISLEGGPVFKINANQRYSSEIVGISRIKNIFIKNNIQFQEYKNRADVPTGSTIGPFVSSNTGIKTIDMGLPQLAMHSANEYMSSIGLTSYINFTKKFFEGE